VVLELFISKSASYLLGWFLHLRRLARIKFN